MDEGHELEEVADWAVEESRLFIDAEQQFINMEHDLLSALLGWHNIIGHLDERIPEDMHHLHQLNGEIAEIINKITELVDRGRLRELNILKEEERLLEHLPKEVEHRDWKSVRRKSKLKIFFGYFLFLIGKKQIKVLRLQEHELKNLHSNFLDLMKIMKRGKLISAIEEDLTVSIEEDLPRQLDLPMPIEESSPVPKQKRKYEELEKLEEYYFLQIYKFVRAYERIFRHLWRKELILSRRLKRDSKRIR